MPKILIIGASGGLGQALVAVYREAEFDVVTLNREDCDLSDPAAVARTATDENFLNVDYDVCVFAAATSDAGYVDALDHDALRRSMEVNFHAQVALFRGLASATPGCRRFVFVLSGAADLLVSGMLAYAQSKRALRDYLYVAEMEKSFAGCRILTVSPGAMDTDLNRKTRIHGEFKLPRGMPPRAPQWVAKRIFQAERAGKKRLNLAPVPTTLGRLQALAPRLTLPLIRWLSGPSS